MRVSVDGTSVVVEFESEAELDAEYAGNIAAGGLSIPTAERIPELSPVTLTLRLAGGGEATCQAMVVRHLASGLAVALEGDPSALAAALRTAPSGEREMSVADRIRSLNRNEKMLLAPKADRAERAFLAQDSDPQVLYSLLRNPRITVEEVARIARSPQLAFATAELILKTAQWASNLDVRVALVHNPRTPTQLALKILPSLPEREIRQIAKATAVSQALRQAALRIVVNRP
jgi:hypothetical protein